jgi:fucose permease
VGSALSSHRRVTATDRRSEEPEQITDATPTPVAYRRLMVASVVCMLMFGAVQVLPAVALDVLGEDLGLNFEQRGRLFSIRIAAALPALLLIGHFAERPFKRHVLSWGLIAIALGQMLIALASNYAWLLCAVVISGIGLGVVEAIVNPLLVQLHPTRSAWALNIINAVFALGLVVGALSTGELLQAGFGWRLTFWLWMIPTLLAAILYLTPHYPAPSPTSDSRHVRPDVRSFAANPLFWMLAVAMVFGGGCESGLTSWAPNFVVEELGASARGGAWATILYGSFMAIGRFGIGSIAGGVSPLRIMLVSAIFCGAATLGLAFAPGLWAAWLLFGLGGLFVSCFWPTLLAVGSDQICVGSMSLLSLLGTAGIIGSVVVPWVIGALGDAVGLRAGILVLPASMVLLIVTLLMIGRRVHARCVT